MKNRLILRLSNEIGNQMFMYASALSISKKLNRELLIDDETAFLLKKNISKYGLDNFEISAKIAQDKYKFKGMEGYLRRKMLIKFDFLRLKKKFYIESKDHKKSTSFQDNYLNKSFSNDVFIEGHFESSKYFINIKDKICDEFTFKNIDLLKKNIFYKELNTHNSVAICLRQNRFIEGRGRNTNENKLKSHEFTLNQVDYINKAAAIIKSKINNPIFYLWSNDFTNIPDNLFEFNFKKIDLSLNKSVLDTRIESLFLLTNCKHYIVTTSTFNWWGAWLSKNLNKIIIRPDNQLFPLFKVNNEDFWPDDWINFTI